MFKSGTSLLRAMLGNHSQIASGLETYWFDIDWNNRDRRDVRERFRLIGEFYNLKDNALEGIKNDCNSSEEFLDRLMDRWCDFQEKERWAEKTPGNIIHIERIQGFWPDAHVLHIVRDPRDIFASLREAKKWDDIHSFMERWGAIFGNINQFRTSRRLEQINYYEVCYEDLVFNPMAVMENVCRFVDLKYEPEIAVFGGKKGEFEKVKSATGKESTTLARLAKPMTTSRVGIWKNILTESEVGALEAAAASEGLAEAYEGACA
jgi:hypothetical protein